MTKQKILYIILKKKWFDQILAGTKSIEYREYKKFWITRLLNKDGTYRQYDVIRFRNGYHSDARYMVVELKEIKLKSPRWFNNEKQFELHLGRILESG